MNRSALWLAVTASMLACDDEQQAVPPDSEAPVSEVEAEDCVDEDLSASATGSTVDAGDDLLGSCGREGGLDRVYRFTAPEAGRYAFDTAGSGFDTVLYVLDSCGGEELACDDEALAPQSEVQVELVAGQEVIVVVDGYGTDSGEYVLNVR